jgi:hypothetical protein
MKEAPLGSFPGGAFVFSRQDSANALLPPAGLSRHARREKSEARLNLNFAVELDHKCSWYDLIYISRAGMILWVCTGSGGRFEKPHKYMNYISKIH